MLMQATTTTTTELNADKKEAGPVVVLAEVGRIGHDLARTSLYDNDTFPRGLGHLPAGSGIPVYSCLTAPRPSFWSGSLREVTHCSLPGRFSEKSCQSQC